MAFKTIPHSVLLAGNESSMASYKDYLESRRYDVQVARNPLETQRLLVQGKIEIILVWDSIQGEDSLLYLMKLREHINTPVIYLSEKDSLSYSLGAYKAGADVFIQLPQPPWMIALKIQAALRCQRDPASAEKAPIRIKTKSSVMELDIDNRKIHYNTQEIELTSQEWEILTYLIERENQIVTRPQLLKNCFSRHEKEGRIIDNHIKNIRSKLKDPRCIQTVRSMGYYFNGEGSSR